MGKIAEHIGHFKDTFGIEIEFCTHDSELLNFTHIEVCTFEEQDDGRDLTEREWKIETDADYTLELVSPILYFENQKQANKFKIALMGELDRIVRSKPTLDVCIEQIITFLTEIDKKLGEKFKNRFNFLPVKYIKKNILIEEINSHNWDTGINLERAIAIKQRIKKNQNFDVKEQLFKNVILSPSKKHGGLPSSQLNHLMELRSYVWYCVNIKESRAWYRLLSAYQDDFLEKWRKKKRSLIKLQYKHLNTTWQERYLNDDYLERRQNENIPIWHRYWFWLVSIRQIAFRATTTTTTTEKHDSLAFDSIKKIVMAEGIMEHPIDPRRYQEIQSIKIDLSKLKNTVDTLEIGLKIDAPDKPIVNEKIIVRTNLFTPIFSVMYVTIHKLISGALGVLSESEQLKYQAMNMDMKGEISNENVLKSCVNNSEFLDFHYALKDLTPLWFKGALGDVLLKLQNEKEDDFKLLIKALQELNSDDVEKILNDNLNFLGRIYTLNEYFHHDNPYNWDEFKAELMPSVSGFVRQFEKGRKELVDVLFNDNIESYTYEKLRTKTSDKFLDRTNVPPWEGRWDTIKPPIEAKKPTRKGKMKGKEVNKEGREIRFLIEHRNN